MVELLVVIGIIGVLISILLPTMARARAAAERVQCASNMRQIGQAMTAYAGENRGWMFPPRNGVNVPGPDRWTVKVFKFAPEPGVPLDDMQYYTPKILLCPSDSRDVFVDPGTSPYVKQGQMNVHSYVVSLNLGNEDVTYSKRDLGGLTPSTFVIMGEKQSNSPAYYMGTRSGDPSDYHQVVNFNRHGRVGSNYLFLDMHVNTAQEPEALHAIDPWRFPAPL